jgi:hypothetical protein
MKCAIVKTNYNIVKLLAFMCVSNTIIKNISPSLQATAQNKFIDIEKPCTVNVEQIFGW